MGGITHNLNSVSLPNPSYVKQKQIACSWGPYKQVDVLESFGMCHIRVFIPSLEPEPKEFYSPPRPDASFPDVLKQHQLTQFTPERFIKVHLWSAWLSEAEMLSTPKVKKKLKRLSDGCRNIIINHQPSG